MNRFLIPILLIIFCIFPLSACDASKKIWEVIKDPGIQVGEDDAQPSMIALHAYAAAEVNKNFDDEPSPIVVKVFALSGDHRLFSYDFFTLSQDPKDALGVTLKGELDETMVAPGIYKILGPYEIPKGTKKLGVIAEYLDIEASIWRSSISIEDIGAEDRLLLLLLEEEVRLIKEE